MRKIFNLILGILMLSSTAFADDFDTINNNLEDMTEIQTDAYLKSLIGTPFSSCGEVYDATKYFIMIDKSRMFPYSSRHIFIFNTPTEIAMSVNKGKEFCFNGTILKIENFPRTDIDISYVSSGKDKVKNKIPISNRKSD